MNNQRRTLSPASIVSMIGAMLFAVAAACMVFLPTIAVSDIPSENEKYVGVFISPFSMVNNSTISMSSRSMMNSEKLKEYVGNGSTLDLSVIGKSGSNFMKNKKDLDKLFDESKSMAGNSTYDSYKTAYDKNFAEVILATIAFFGLIGCAVAIIIGKALQSTSAGRSIALVFSIIGLACAATFMIVTIVNLDSFDTFYKNAGLSGYKDHVSIGVGPILMTVFSAVTLVFCCIGNGNGAYRYVGGPVSSYNPNTPYNGYNDGFNANSFAQPPVQPQQPYNSYNPGGYGQPQNPFAPPVQPQNPFAPPVQPARPQSAPVSGESTIPLNQINRGTGMSGEGTIPLNQLNKGSGMSGEGTIPLNQLNKGSGMSGEGTIPLNQINKNSSGMSGEGTVPLNRVRSQSGEETVPLNRVRSQSGEGTIPLSMVGAVPKNAAVGTLKCVKGDFPSLSVDLKPDEKVIIGRDPASCSVIVGADRSDVSRTHCSIWYDPAKDSFKIKDTSSNGTFVNGQKLPKDQTVQIPDNSIISLGNGDNQFKIVKN